MTESIATKYKVPAQLRPLLEAFARETLRAQPEDLIEFGRGFFETLHLAQKANPKADVIGEEKLYNQFRTSLQQHLTAREPTTPESTKEPDQQELQELSQRDSDLPPPPSGGETRPLIGSDSNRTTLPPLQLQSQRGAPEPDRYQTAAASSSRFNQQQQQSAVGTQANSKVNTGRMQPPQQSSQPGSSNNSRPTSPEALAATKIQAVYRGHFVRKHPDKFGIDTLDFTRRRSNNQLTDFKKDLKRHSVGGYSLETAQNSPDDRAATRIQAQIRGYLARKHADAMKQKNEEAAKKIQSHIRGFLTRKKLVEEGMVGSRSSLHSADGSLH